MATKASAGIVVYRSPPGGLEVFLVHPGGPYHARKDLGVWSIPKGQLNADESPLAAATREFTEETGQPLPAGELRELTPVIRPSGKPIYAWAIAGELVPDQCFSNHVELEWPPHSGQLQSFPEVDRYGWFSLDEARTRLVPAQTAFLDQLKEYVR